MRELNRVLDIVGLIKKLRVAQRNIEQQRIPFYDKLRRLKIETDEVDVRPRTNVENQDSMV